MAVPETLSRLHAVAAHKNGNGDGHEPSTGDLLRQILEAVGGIAEKQEEQAERLGRIEDRQSKLEGAIEALRGQMDTCIDASKAAASALIQQREDHAKALDDLRYEVQVTNQAALSARADAEGSHKAAAAIGEMLAEREREHRRGRDSSPSIPGLAKTDPGDPHFESDAPEPA